MAIEVVTFDCAQTLVNVDWKMGEFAVEIAEAIGISVPENAGTQYLNLFRKRISDFHSANLTRSQRAVRDFWIQLNFDWLTNINCDCSLSEALLEESEAISYRIPSRLFSLFDDVVPCLTQLKKMGLRLGIISNWDISLHRVIDLFKLNSYFDVVLASLEEGVEKPNIRLFEIACEKMKVEPRKCLHIGDDAIDDLQGAKNAGFKAAIIDRNRNETTAPYLHSLNNSCEALHW